MDTVDAAAPEPHFQDQGDALAKHGTHPHWDAENQHDDREQLAPALSISTLYGRNGLCFHFLIHKVFIL